MQVESVLITGAGRGLGLEFVRQFIGLQNPPKHVFATCRNPAKVLELQQLIMRDSACKVHCIQLDVCDGESIASAERQVEQILDGAGLNLLINNAGICSFKNFAQITAEDMLLELNTNTVSPLMITKVFLPLLQRASTNSKSSKLSMNRAGVVNISSTIGTFSGLAHSFYAYSVSKCGLNMLTAMMAKDLSPHGILVAAIHPGWVQTDMGGKSAHLDAGTSVNTMLNTFMKLSDSDAGRLFNYNGEQMAW